MASKYSKDQIEEKIKEAIKNPNTFYTQGFINYRGTLADDPEKYYCEYISELLIEKNYINAILEIKPVCRKNKSYKTGTHDGKSLFNDSNREEEKIAMLTYLNQDGLDEIGEIIDYQTPLKGKETDQAGKVDLLSYDKKTKTARFLELKKPNSEETLLRCILESYTYTKFVEFEKLKNDFKENGMMDCEKLIPCPLIFSSGRPYEDYQRVCNGEYKYTKQLIEKLGEEIIQISEKQPSNRVFTTKKLNI